MELVNLNTVWAKAVSIKIVGRFIPGKHPDIEHLRLYSFEEGLFLSTIMEELR